MEVVPHQCSQPTRRQDKSRAYTLETHQSPAMPRRPRSRPFATFNVPGEQGSSTVHCLEPLGSLKVSLREALRRHPAEEVLAVIHAELARQTQPPCPAATGEQASAVPVGLTTADVMPVR